VYNGSGRQEHQRRWENSAATEFTCGAERRPGGAGRGAAWFGSWCDGWGTGGSQGAFKKGVRALGAEIPAVIPVCG